MMIEPTVQNYFWIKSIMDREINKGTNRDEFSLLKCCECFFTSFMPELTVEQVIDLMGKVVPCLSDDKSNLLMDFLFKTIRTQKEFEKMEKINVVIKEELFKKIGLVVEKCSAYTDGADNYVRINGAIITKKAWDENYCLKVKASYHFYLTHYPTLVSHEKIKPVKTVLLNLYGHTHQKEHFYEGHPYMYCVCLDAHELKPVLLDDIIEEIKKKKSAYREGQTLRILGEKGKIQE